MSHLARKQEGRATSQRFGFAWIVELISRCEAWFTAPELAPVPARRTMMQDPQLADGPWRWG